MIILGTIVILSMLFGITFYRLFTRNTGIIAMVFCLIVSAGAYWFLGDYKIDIKQSEPQNPLIALQENLKESPKDPKNWQLLAKAYLVNNQYNEAIFSYTQALEYGAPNAQVYSGAALAHYELNQQKSDEIIEGLIDKSLSLDALDPTAIMLRATIFLASSRYQEANDLWQSLLDSRVPNIDRKQIILNIERIAPFLRNIKRSSE